MKNLHKYILFGIFSTFLNACKKEKNTPIYGSINVINASVNLGSVKVNSYGKPISWVGLTGADGTVNYGANKIYTLFNSVGNYPIFIVPTLDTLNTIFKGNIPQNSSDIYSIYTSGQAPNYESIIYKENDIPYNLPDSLVSVRFINLSPNSPIVKITLASKPTVAEIENLAYKEQTKFKQYPLRSIIPAGSITFEVRNLNTNSILTTYTLPTVAILPYSNVTVSRARFRSITLVIKGLAGTTSGINIYNVFPIAHY